MQCGKFKACILVLCIFQTKNQSVYIFLLKINFCSIFDKFKKPRMCCIFANNPDIVKKMQVHRIKTIIVHCMALNTIVISGVSVFNF